VHVDIMYILHVCRLSVYPCVVCAYLHFYDKHIFNNGRVMKQILLETPSLHTFHNFIYV